MTSRKRVGRNAPCPCGKIGPSGKRLKFKNCCGKPVYKKQELKYHDLRVFYNPAQREADATFVRQWGFRPNPTQLRIFMTCPEDVPAMIRSVLTKNRASAAFIDAVLEAKRLSTPLNRELWSADESREYVSILTAHGVTSAKGNL